MKINLKRSSAASVQEKRVLLAQLLRRPSDAPAVAPLSYGQKALYFLHRSDPESPAYHVAFTARFHSPVDTGALKKALQSLVDRHEQLRARFVLRDGEPVQAIASRCPVVFEQVDAAAWSDARLDAAVREAYRQPFDLERGPLFRAHLFTRDGHDHVFLITIHHIVYDAWSLWINQSELGRLYRAEVDGTRVVLPSIKRSYADFIRWQADMLQGPEGTRLSTFWQNQLDGHRTPIKLPTDRPRPPVQTYVGESVVFRLGDDLTHQLRQLAKLQSATPFMLLLAAFQVLLHRYSGDDEILVGSPSAGRSQAAYAQTVGYFVNTLVLKADLSGNPSFQELLIQVQKTVLEALEHQDYPFPLLIERLQPVRDPSYSPIVQVSFAYQKPMVHDATPDLFSALESGKHLAWGGLDTEYYPLTQQEGQFDLELEIVESGSAFHGSFKYNNDLFEQSTIDRMVSHFETLLQGIVARPEHRVGCLPLLTGAENQRLLDWANEKGHVHPCGYAGDLITLFESQVEARPNAIAVSDGEQCLTYHALNVRANQLAHYLRRLGVGPEVLVGLYLDRSANLIVGIMGILKAGGAYLPLDSSYPRERLAFMLADSGVPVIVTQADRVSALPQTTAELVYLHRDLKVIEKESEDNPETDITPDTLAYVIYTSGSTGKPKGVEINHFNVTRLFAATRHWYHFDEHDVWTMFHSIAFDFSVWEIWGALIHGGHLVIVPFAVSRDADAFYTLLAEARVTVLNQTPSAFRQLLHVEDDAQKAKPLHLRLVIFGGEMLDLKSLRPWFTRHGDDQPQLINMYGITETTVHVTYRPLAFSDVENDASLIGRPIPDLSLYILDKHLQPAPIGIKGEIYVAGAGVSRGYLNCPELTRERFIQNPFSERPGDRLYKTGDLARYLPKGDIEYFGRIDSQVKVRGFRIELGEIEAILRQHQNVAETVVLVREDTPDDKRLLAYVVPRQAPQPSADELRAYLKEHLPDYSLPAAIIVLDAMPINHNGKLDRGALPLPENWRSGPGRHLVIPRDIYEQRLVLMWEETLKVSPIGIQDNFFELGGHSLLAMGLMAQLEREFKAKLPLSALFQAPTVERLAELLRRQDLNPRWSPLVPIQSKGTRPRFFCIAGGVGSVLYYYPLAHRLGPDQPFYGLQSKGINGDCLPYTHVQDMARHYIEGIRSIQPEGPYWLGGHCFGGIVAFEIAQQLVCEGQSIALLALFDIPAPGQGAGSTVCDSDDATWVLRLGQLLEQASGKDLGLSLDALRLLELEEQAQYLKEGMIKAQMLPAGAGTSQVRGLVQVFKANSLARYTPPAQVHPLPIALFRASEYHSDYDYSAADRSPTDGHEATLGWCQYARGPLEVNVVPGNHVTMMWEPHVQGLAECLGATLARSGHWQSVMDLH